MSRQPVKVLLVEDEDAIKAPLTKYLTHTCDCQVDAVKDADGALTRLEETHGNFDMALINDLLVPKDGQEPQPMGAFLTREFKTRYPEMEIIVFIGRGRDSALEALRAGAYRYLTKPLNYEELKMLIQTAVEHRRLKGIAREKQILEQLMETSTALLSGHGLSEMLDTILHGIQALGYDRVCLYLVSDDGQSLIGRAQVGFENNLVGHTRPIDSDTYMQRLIADPRPLICARKTDPPLMYEEVMDRQDVDQWACIPLVLRGEVIGKISIDNKYSRQPILESELRPIALFASQAAEAIEHTRLYEQVAIERDRSNSKADQLFALYEIAKQMQLQLDLKSLLDLVSYQATTLLGADSGGILLLDDDKQSLTFKGGYGLGERILKGTRDGLGRSIAGRVAKAGEAIVANDIPNDPRFENPAADEEGFLAII
ncbi:MAG: GAF domain-containing protein, partial [Anaerolineae bacterium]|nr:GAF domain-containing protein [Anaerolineae bacterium]